MKDIYDKPSAVGGDNRLVTLIVQRFQKLQGQRTNYEPVWDEITDFVLPSRGSYSDLRSNTPAQRRDRRILDITGIISARTLSSRVVSEMTSASDRWFNIKPADVMLERVDAVQRFLFDVAEKAYDALQESWRLAHIEATSDWVAYGTACMYVEEHKEDGEEAELYFKAIPVQELFIAENFKGKVDTVYRHFSMSIRQIAQEFGTDLLPGDLMKCLDQDPDHEFELIHAVYPNADRVKDAKMKDKMKFKSCYVLKEKEILLREGGFKEMPFIVFRFWKRTGEPYGGSPAWDALSDIRMINAMSETALRAFQLEAFPPLLAASDGVIMPLKTTPNGVNIGGMSPEGKRLIEPLMTGSKTQMAFEVLEQRRMAIRNAFFVDPLINRESSIRTAAEVQKRASEELSGISPFINRFEQEYLEPLIERVLTFVLETQIKPEEIPQELQGKKTKIEYTAPLARTQKAKQLDATVTFLQLVQNVAQADPSIMQTIRSSEMIGMMANLLGVPLWILKSQGELEEEKQAAAQQQQIEQMLQAGPAIGQTIKNSAEGLKSAAETAQIGITGQGAI